jgi:hypothetical protein
MMHITIQTEENNQHNFHFAAHLACFMVFCILKQFISAPVSEVTE